MDFIHGDGAYLQNSSVTISFEQFQLLMTLSSHMEQDIMDYYGKEGVEVRINYSDIKHFYRNILDGCFRKIK